jgi:hypothetical protein
VAPSGETYKLDVSTVATVVPSSPAAVSPVTELVGIKATLGVSLDHDHNQMNLLGTAKSENHEKYRSYIFT